MKNYFNVLPVAINPDVIVKTNYKLKLIMRAVISPSPRADKSRGVVWSPSFDVVRHLWLFYFIVKLEIENL